MAAQLNQANFGQAQSAAQQDIATQSTGPARQPGGAAKPGRAQHQRRQRPDRSRLRRRSNRKCAISASRPRRAVSSSSRRKTRSTPRWRTSSRPGSTPTMQLGTLQSALGMTPYGNAHPGPVDDPDPTAANPAGEALGGDADARQPVLGPGGRHQRRERHRQLPRRPLRSAAQDRHHQGRQASVRHRHLRLSLQGRPEDIPESGRTDGGGRSQAFRSGGGGARSPAPAARWPFTRPCSARSPPRPGVGRCHPFRRSGREAARDRSARPLQASTWGRRCPVRSQVRECPARSARLGAPMRRPAVRRPHPPPMRRALRG